MDLVRKPLNPATGTEYEKCEYALFSSCNLGAFEPEIVVKLYDSLRFQKEDTGIMIMCCGFAVKREGAPDWQDAFNDALSDVRAAWESLGRPTLICPCPTCMKTLGEALPEIPTVSLYKMLNEFGINGGCNSVEYYLWEDGSDDDSNLVNDLKELAENMGVKLQPAPADPADAEYPYITCNINIRNMLKSRGKDAAHILELIYGMGDSNTHLVHEHDHGEDHAADETGGGTAADCDGDCSPCALCAGCTDKPQPPAPLPDEEQQNQNRTELKETMLALFW